MSAPDELAATMSAMEALDAQGLPSTAVRQSMLTDAASAGLLADVGLSEPDLLARWQATSKR